MTDEKIPFNQPSITQLEMDYTAKALNRLACDSWTTEACRMFKEATGVDIWLTATCAYALETAALLADIGPGDEVIMPAFTASATANAFLMRGAVVKFCEIDPYTLNMCPFSVMSLISKKTKVIVPVHYAGVPCDVDALPDDYLIIEDAAQAVGSTYNDKPVGMLGDMGCYSFGCSQNYTMGEGGGLYVRDHKRLAHAGHTSQAGVPQIGAALLCAQLTRFSEILNNRMAIWNLYHMAFTDMEDKTLLRCPTIPTNATHNAHIYYIILPTTQKRDALMQHLNQNGIEAASHYLPLHMGFLGHRLGYRAGDLPVSEEYAGRILRLPLWADMTMPMVERIVESVKKALL
jgi:dTDP-4-amino-4,6-dideoxygalactose transaminase